MTGEFKKKLTKPTKITSHKVGASPENPGFLVESEKTEAAHKSEGLKKAK